MSANNEGHPLFIEDHHDIGEMVCEYLERSDYVMNHAADGVTGLHFAVKNDYDGIIIKWLIVSLLQTMVSESQKKMLK